ncbi:hypothetical protein AB3M83_01300 [Microbacterium sp. 179-B 1A2 NHS]|uniref:hypothetical protein n=1 Tax=Microbacterium sp. 179-B 1A2 NHS TaxID=3142383 RepID=UPI0039A3BD28
MTSPSLAAPPRKVGPALTGAARRAYLVRRGIAAEAAGWRSIGRYLARRPRVPTGSEGFSYDGPIRTVLVVFVVLSAVEVPVIDLLTRPWPAVRYPLLALGLWGVATMLGMLLGYRTRPHAVGPAGIRVRSGGEVDIDLPWELVASVSRRRRSLTGAPTLSLTGADEDQVLNHLMQDFTDIDIALEGLTGLRLPQGDVVVREVRISVDDPEAFLAAVRRHMP